MEVSREFSHEKRVDGRFQQRETTEVSLRLEETRAGLEIDYEEDLIQEGQSTLATFEIETIDISDIRRMCDRLGKWCGGDTNDTVRFETGYVEGKCAIDGQSTPLERLRFTVDTNGLQVEALEGTETIGRVCIPPCPHTEDGEPARPIHIHSFKSFLQTALSCTGNFDDELGPRLDAAGEFTGPFHQGLLNICINQYHNGNHSQAVANAGHELERDLKERLDGYQDISASDMMAQVFNKDNSELQLSSDTDQQQGIQFLFQGAIKALRNPLTHGHPDPETDTYPDRVTRRHARDILYFFDYLYLVLDEADYTGDTD